jgi:hypothetical protein
VMDARSARLGLSPGTGAALLVVYAEMPRPRSVTITERTAIGRESQ